MIILHASLSTPRLPYPDTVLLSLLIFAGLAATVLLSMGLIAFLRRQSRSYLLVILALGTLVCKVGAGGLTLVGILPSNLHHVMEHGLDLAMAVLLIAAVYYTRAPLPSKHGVRE